MGVERTRKHGASTSAYRNLEPSLAKQSPMKKQGSDLTSRIAELGAGLATRPRPVQPDIVVGKTRSRRLRTKNLSVRLGEVDIAMLNELELWTRQNNLRLGWGTILKGSLRLVQKDEKSLRVLRETLERDGRRRS